MFGRKHQSEIIQAAAIQAATQIVLFSAARKEGEITADELSRVAALGAVALLQEFEKRRSVGQ
jgi:hypothetical protein